MTATIYVACPISLYPLPNYDEQLDRVRARFPDASLIDARSAWTSDQDWHAGWPDLLPNLSGLVLVAEPDGFIGAGCWQELMDAVAWNVPVWFLNDNGVFHDSDDLSFALTDGQDWRHFARVLLSEDRGGDA